MAEPTLLSGSSLNTFIECPKEWEYVYLWRLERPPSYKMALGTAAHYVVEMAMRHRMALGFYPEKDFWADTFIDAWATESANSKPRNDRPEEQEAPHVESGLRCVEFYRTGVAPAIVPFSVEDPIRITINGHVWTGKIDLLEDASRVGFDGQMELHLRLRDHKFTSKRPDNPKRYRIPMIGYALGLRHKYGVVEDDVQLDYIIRNKKPVHFPVALGGPASEQDVLDLAQEIEDAMSMIQRGSFPPLGSQTGACNWCPARDVCPDVKKRSYKKE